MVKYSRMRTMWVLARRDLLSTLYGVGIYATIFITTLVAGFVLRNYLSSVSADRMLITSSPLDFPFFVTVVVCSIYLAVSSATTIAREKDQQTLEVLFYGPVDHVSYVMGKYVKGMLGYGVIGAFLIFYFLVASGLTNLGLSVRFLETLVLSIFLVSCVVSFGILLSTLTNSVRASVLLFLGVMFGLLALQVSHSFLLGMRSEVMSEPLQYIRDAISLINRVVRWISPFSYFQDGLDAISLGSGVRYLLSAISSSVYSVILLILSVLIFRGKGVR